MQYFYSLYLSHSFLWLIQDDLYCLKVKVLSFFLCYIVSMEVCGSFKMKIKEWNKENAYVKSWEKMGTLYPFFKEYEYD